MRKIFLYLSAFLPMFAIMWIKELFQISITEYKAFLVVKSDESKNIELVNNIFDSLLSHNKLLIVELVVILLVLLVFIYLLNGNKRLGTHRIKVKAVKNRTAEYYLAYSSLFILALIGLSLTSVIDVITMVLLMTVMGIVYIRNDLYFINPTINILKSYIYEVEFCENDKTLTKLIMAKEKFYEGDVIDIEISEFDFTFMRKKHEQEKYNNE